MNTPHYRQFRRLFRLGLGSLLAAASFTAFGQANVLTQHNDNSRSGANTLETILTTANVNQSQFGKIFTESVDGQVYAQPLYVSALSLAGGTHNVVYVCTEHNSVYAFDANTGGAALWQVNLGPSVTNQNCADISPEVGITGTPVIDLSTNTLYVSAETEVGANTFHTLHALDLGTGAEKFGAPVTITATSSGVTFNAFNQGQRPGLLLLNGVVYLTFASHCDNNVWHGWVLGYRAGPSTIAQVAALCLTPTAGSTGAGIWACGMGPAADANGFIYANTGNGSWDGTSNFGDSFLKISTVGGLSVSDYFTPHNQASLSSADMDIGTGGPVLVPPHYVVGLAKSGSMYLCDQNNMGHYNATTDSCLQVFSATGVNDTTSSSPVYWAGPSKQYLFIACGDDTPKAYQFTGTSVNTTALGQGSVVANRPGGTSLSSNGTANGILWTVGSNSVMYAYNAVSFPAVLWNSSQNAGRDGLGTYVKFATPTIANGMVYVGTSNQLVAYGLIGGGLPQVATPTFSPGGGAYAGAQTVTISDSTSGASIRYTLDGSTPSETAGTLYSGPVTIGSTVTLNAIAYLSGDADSPVASAVYTIGTGVEGPFGGSPAAIPGTVQAENYDTGGQGVGYNVTTVNGTDNAYRPDGVDLEVTTDTGGGVNLGWTAAGQWFKYTVNVATAGTYTVSFRVAAATAAVTDAFHLANSSGTNLSGSVNVPDTGAWQTWATVTANVTLPAGQQVLTLDEDNAGWNLNDMSFGTGTLTSVITAIAGPNGSISPSGTVVVNYGANQTFTITPNPGYAVASVTDNGTSLGAVTTYTFTDVQVNHEISATFVAIAIPSIEINCGGPAVSPFVADEDFTAGATIDHANTINTSTVTNPAPAAVYQSARIGVAAATGPGAPFTYTIGGFTAGSSHTVRLHFAETYFTTAGSRVFNVSINGTQVLTNFDIVAASGGENIANIQQFTETANASGQYVITFTSVTNNALISGIEID
jgi:hypothetical protein